MNGLVEKNVVARPEPGDFVMDFSGQVYEVHAPGLRYMLVKPVGSEELISIKITDTFKVPPPQISKAGDEA